VETIILTLVVASLAGLAVWYYNRDSNSLDVNHDGKVDAEDAVAAAKQAVSGLKQDAREARDAALVAAAESAMKAAGVIEAAKKTTKAKVQKVTDKVVAAKKTATRKPRSKK
jgi:hypothetical protein